MRKQFGQYLKELRITKGLSQGDVAKKLGLSTSQSISNIERGIAPLPAKHFKLAAKVLGVEPMQLAVMYFVAEEKQFLKEARIR